MRSPDKFKRTRSSRINFRAGSLIGRHAEVGESYGLELSPASISGNRPLAALGRWGGLT
jgi:hypothetical protein